MANETATFESGSFEDASTDAPGADGAGIGSVSAATAAKPVADNGQNRLATLEAGLDALDTAVVRTRRPWWRVLVSKVLPPVVALVVILAIWDLLVVMHVHSGEIMLPGPGDVWDSLTTNWGPSRMGAAIWDSVYRAAIGFAASVVIGTVIGLLVARIAPLRAAVQPLLSGLQNLPSVAWVPPALMFFGPEGMRPRTLIDGVWLKDLSYRDCVGATEAAHWAAVRSPLENCVGRRLYDGGEEYSSAAPSKSCASGAACGVRISKVRP